MQSRVPDAWRLYSQLTTPLDRNNSPMSIVELEKTITPTSPRNYDDAFRVAPASVPPPSSARSGPAAARERGAVAGRSVVAFGRQEVAGALLLLRRTLSGGRNQLPAAGRRVPTRETPPSPGRLLKSDFVREFLTRDTRAELRKPPCRYRLSVASPPSITGLSPVTRGLVRSVIERESSEPLMVPETPPPTQPAIAIEPMSMLPCTVPLK